MATFKSDGLKDIEKQINQLKLNADDIETVLRAGGLEVVNALKSQVSALPTRDSSEYGRSNHKVTGITEEQKQGLLHDIGTAKMQTNNGYYDIKVGLYRGYVGKPTRTYPQGVPSQMLLRSLEKGTSWLNKKPVVAPAYRQSKDKAVEQMQKALDKIIKK